MQEGNMAISKDVTISEIAARANVSIATVSRVINQAGNTKAETKQKVLQAMAELGLNPSTYCGIKAPADSRSILVTFPTFKIHLMLMLLKVSKMQLWLAATELFFTQLLIYAFLYMNTKKLLIRTIFAVYY